MGIGGIVGITLRALEFLWTLIVMALVGNMIATADNGNPAVVNFALFVSVFSMLSLFYLIPAAIKEAFAMSIVTLALDLINVLLFFCSAVALAAELGAHSCSNKKYLKNNGVVNGAHDKSSRCHEAQAACAFLFFGLFTYIASAVMSGLSSRGGGGRVGKV